MDNLARSFFNDELFKEDLVADPGFCCRLATASLSPVEAVLCF